MEIAGKEFKTADREKSGGLLIRLDYTSDPIPLILVVDDHIIELYPHLMANGQERLRVVAHPDVKILGPHRLKAHGLINCIIGETDDKKKQT